jgi:rhodanese-related sulfurtransferase
MAMAVAMAVAPAAAPACACRHSTAPAPLMSFIQPVGRRRLVVRSIATGPPKSATEVEWKSKRETLKKNNLRSVKPKDALRLQQEQGYVLLDVRPEGEYNEAHAEGAVNAQLYRLIKEWTPWDIARRAGFAFFGIFQGTEENPEFLNEVKALGLDKESKIILGCQSGGTMKPSPSLADGQQSRSLIAAYILALEGFKNLVHLEGGLRAWFREDLPIEGTDTVEDGEEEKI